VSESTAPACPFCQSGEAERVGQWGGQLITAQWRCHSCGSYFEAIRTEFDDGQAAERLAAPVSPSSERK
jgi:ribosomal protein L37AE/L43A